MHCIQDTARTLASACVLSTTPHCVATIERALINCFLVETRQRMALGKTDSTGNELEQQTWPKSETVIASRSGDVLIKSTLLKADHFPGAGNVSAIEVDRDVSVDVLEVWHSEI